ncbi:cyclin [Cryptosporidium sp. chipmunk genotype I]|uniref:cyclin n=1 Tax=Cryptosporidium sp. chipmunk genotype I TaxID=1280935 RepID=UPI00351A2265|nr:cyclin [Cryptosporidium sp. chipmunk genotype I]
MIEDKSTFGQNECIGGVNQNIGVTTEKAQMNVQNSSSSSMSSSNNVGGSKSFSTCRRWMISGRFQDILPKESLTMSLMDWEDLYRRERLAQVHHSVYTTSGCFLQLDQRQLVMSWISDVAHRLAWEKSTFHIATSLIDQYMFCLERDPVSRRKLDRSSLAATFAAAVVTAASLGECLGECHDRKHCPGLPPLHRFVQSSGIIRSSRDIVEMQIQLLVQTSRYGGPSLLNKTPAHMTLHYLSRLKHLVDSLHSSLSEVLPSSSWPFGSQNKENFPQNIVNTGGGEAADGGSTNMNIESDHPDEILCCKKGACWANKIGLSTTVGQAVLGIREKINYAYLFEKIMFAHELALYSGLNLLVPGSRIAACVLINILISYDPILQFPSHQNILYNSLCLLDYDTGIRPFMPYLDPLVRRVISMSMESIQALENSGTGAKYVGAKAGITAGMPLDDTCSGVILIHKHHVIPDKLLSGLWVSNLIAMHSRMSQSNIMTQFSLSSPSSIPVSPHSSLGSVSGSPGTFQCSQLFYSLGGSRCYLDDKALVQGIGKGRFIGGGGGGAGFTAYGTNVSNNSGCRSGARMQLLENSGGFSGKRVLAEGEQNEIQYGSGDYNRDSVSLKLFQKQQNHGHFVGNHLHLVSNRVSDDQHLYTTCSTATNSPLFGGPI